MIFKKYLMALVLLMAGLVAWPALAAEPSMQDIYKAAQAGKLDQAQEMMRSVLQAHPNSAKAHFVEAELLAKQREFVGARNELDTAERLAPGLPFAKPEAVNKLKSLLAAHPTAATTNVQPVRPVSAQPVQAAMPEKSSGFGFMPLLIGAGVLVLVFMLIRGLINRVSSPTVITNGGGNYSLNGGFSGGGYPQAGYPQPGYPPSGGGMGSGILGGLATGVAVGAGVAVGEQVVRRLMDGGEHTSAAPSVSSWDANAASLPDDTSSYDMGGNDFGVSDNSSWDDNSSFGGGGDSSDSSDWS